MLYVNHYRHIPQKQANVLGWPVFSTSVKSKMQQISNHTTNCRADGWI